MEDVKEGLTAKVVKQKKAEQIMKEYNDAMASGKTIEEIAAKMKVELSQPYPNVNFGSGSGVPDLGNDGNFLGTVAALKAKTFSKPIAGNEGVFVVYVDSKTDAPVQKDYKAQQAAQLATMSQRVDYEVYDALKQNANVTEHLVRFY